MACCKKVSHTSIKAKVKNSGSAAKQTYHQNAKAAAKIKAINKARAKAFNSGPIKPLGAPPKISTKKAKPKKEKGCKDCTKAKVITIKGGGRLPR